MTNKVLIKIQSQLTEPTCVKDVRKIASNNTVIYVIDYGWYGCWIFDNKGEFMYYAAGDLDNPYEVLKKPQELLDKEAKEEEASRMRLENYRMGIKND